MATLTKSLVGPKRVFSRAIPRQKRPCIKRSGPTNNRFGPTKSPLKKIRGATVKFLSTRGYTSMALLTPPDTKDYRLEKKRGVYRYKEQYI